MKRIVFISFVFTLLLAGGKTMHANVHKLTIDSETKWDSFVKEQMKFNKLNRSNLMTKYTDFDLEEELSTNNDYDSSASNLPHVKQYFLGKWFLSFNDALDETYNTNLRYSSESNLGQSTPIYLFYSVLRI